MSYVNRNTLRLRLNHQDLYLLLPRSTVSLDLLPRRCFRSMAPFDRSPLLRKRAAVRERGTTHRASQITPLSERADLSVRYTPRCGAPTTVPPLSSPPFFLLSSIFTLFRCSIRFHPVLPLGDAEPSLPPERREEQRTGARRGVGFVLSRRIRDENVCRCIHPLFTWLQRGQPRENHPCPNEATRSSLCEHATIAKDTFPR